MFRWRWPPALCASRCGTFGPASRASGPGPVGSQGESREKEVRGDAGDSGWPRLPGAAGARETGGREAAYRALASADAAEAAGAPIEAALSRTVAGRALAGTGDKDRAVAELQRAAAALDACGAWRYRQGAERELGKLGHRPHRRTRPGRANGAGIEALTERELQVARLVVDRKTNPQIAAELFLSQKTIETHLRNIFHKMGVTTRAALARAVERAEPPW